MSLTLAETKKQKTYQICAYASNSETTQKQFECLGFVEGEKVSLYQASCFGGPLAINVRGSVIAMRLADAEQIFVKELS